MMPTHLWLLTATVIASLAVGCVPQMVFTAHGAACEPRPEGCEVTLITRRPDRDFQIIGVVDVEAISVRRIPNDEEAFLALITPKACAVGADGVIPGQTGDNRYIQGTLVKWVEDGQTEPACVEEDEEAEGAEPSGAAEDGAEESSAETTGTENPEEPAESAGESAEPSEPGPEPEPEATENAAAPCEGGTPC